MATLLACMAVLCWTVVTVRLPRRGGAPASPELKALWLSLFGLAAGLTTQVPSIYFRLGSLAGVPNVGMPIGQSFVLVAGWAASVLLLYSTYPATVAARKAMRRFLGVAVGLVTMVVLFAVTPASAPTLQFVATYGSRSSVATYYLIYLGLLALAAADIGRLCWRYAGLAKQDGLRLGLHLIAASAAVALAYVVYKGAFVASDHYGLRLPLGGEPDVSRSLMLLGTVLVLAGTTISVWGSRLRIERIYSRWRSYCSYRRLSSLWWALYNVTPEIALYPASIRRLDAMVARDLEFRLHRRVIEIRDGWLKLRPYLDHGDAVEAREAGVAEGLRGDLLQAHVQAVVLGVGVAAKAAGVPASASWTEPLPLTAESTSEIAWLERIARAFDERFTKTIIAARAEGRTACQG